MIDFFVKTERSEIVPAIYTVFIYPDYENGGYWAECPMDIGGCFTTGETIHETQRNMYESVDLYLEDYPVAIDYILSFKMKNA
jgi:predicted RNase H-like HicB family nuclease